MAISSIRGSTLPNKSFTAGKAKTKNVVRIAPETATTFANGAAVSAGGGGGGPTISNVSVTDSSYILSNTTPYIDSTGGYIKITGTGFAAGCTVYVSGTPATSTTFISSTEVRAQVGAAASNAQAVYVVNTDSSVAILLNAITYSGTPSWSTGATLSSQVSDIAFSISLSATSDSSIVYTLASGSSTPSGTTLYSNGTFAGTVTGISSDTNYSFTVVATDIENQLSARAFTVTVATGDQYFYVTPLLLNGEASVWIRDSSTNNLLPTISGDSRPTAFSPYNTDWSAYFDGTNDYLTCTTSTTFGTGDFTVECWVNMPAVTNTYSSGIIGTTNYNGIDRGWALDIVGSSGYPRFYLYNSSGTGVTLTSSTVLPANRWTHLAAVRSGTTVTIYMNGVSIASGTNATNDNFSAPIYFGTIATSFALGVSGYSYTGYISNARVVVGVAVYTGAFTPPATKLGSTQSAGTNIAAITGTSTSLLTLQDNRFKDNSVNAFTLTRSGTQIKSFGPFTETDTTTGSAFFDGNGDYLTFPTNTGLNFSTGDFTIEFWAYLTANPSNDWMFISAVTTGGLFFGVANFTSPFGIGFGRAGIAWDYLTTVTPQLNSWTHYVLTRTGTSVRIFVNGVQIGTTQTLSTSYDIGLGGMTVGAQIPGTLYMTGYMTDLRVVKGVGVYTGTFTPTTSLLPLTQSSSTNVAAITGTSTSISTLQYRRGDNNHRFVDESGVKALITRAGNANQGSFSPFSPAGWSGYFDGTSTSYLNVVSNAAFAFGTGDFTLEAWIYLPSYPSAGTIAGQIISAHNWTGGTIDFGFRVNTAGPLYFEATGGANLTSTISVPLNQWNHVACVRNSGTVTFYINGLSRGSASITTSIPSTTAISLGHSLSGGTYGALTGYISNARVVKGVAVYTGNFTPQTSSLSSTQSSGSNIAAITGTSTSLLTLQDNRFKDNSSNAFTLTISGSKIQAFSPFRPSGSYSLATHGGSAYFDGSGDYVSVASSTAMTLLTNTHTVEFWMYPDGTQSVYSCPWYYNGSIVYYFSIGSYGGGDVSLLVGGGSPWSIQLISGNTEYLKLLNNWTHVVITRSGTAFRMFFNGRLIAYGTASTSITAQTSAFQIGWDGTNATTYYKGWLSNFRIINGSVPAAYQTASTTTGTTIFTPPTAVPAFEANTAMAMNFTHGGIIDASARHVFETLGDMKISNVASKFGTGSLSFDGTSDGLYEPYNPLYAFGTGDFTIEFWMNFSSKTGYQTIIVFGYVSNTNGGWLLQTGNGDGNMKFYFGNNGDIAVALESGSTVNTGTWYHIAVVRTGGNTKIYRNGTQVATGADTNNYNPATSTRFYIGGGDTVGFGNYYFNGYIDDLRISRYARYTSAFTAPTQAFLTK